MREIAADAVIIKDGKILLVKRGTQPFLGMWAVPGGRLEGNETLEQCAIRETREESGLEAKVERLVGIYSKPARDPRKIIAAAYLCSITGGTQKPQQGEINEVRWFSLDNLPPLASDHAQIIQDARKLVGSNL